MSCLGVECLILDSPLLDSIPEVFLLSDSALVSTEFAQGAVERRLPIVFQ